MTIKYIDEVNTHDHHPASIDSNGGDGQVTRRVCCAAEWAVSIRHDNVKPSEEDEKTHTHTKLELRNNPLANGAAAAAATAAIPHPLVATHRRTNTHLSMFRFILFVLILNS